MAKAKKILPDIESGRIFLYLLQITVNFSLRPEFFVLLRQEQFHRQHLL